MWYKRSQFCFVFCFLWFWWFTAAWNYKYWSLLLRRYLNHHDRFIESNMDQAGLWCLSCCFPASKKMNQIFVGWVGGIVFNLTDWVYRSRWRGWLMEVVDIVESSSSSDVYVYIYIYISAWCGNAAYPQARGHFPAARPRDFKTRGSTTAPLALFVIAFMTNLQGQHTCVVCPCKFDVL